MTRREFYTITGAITRKAAAWTHEGICAGSLAGDMPDEAVQRFCEEVQSFLDRMKAR